MYKTVYCLFALFMASTIGYAQAPEHIDPLAPGENIYKHFTGTVGDHKAVLDLRLGFQGTRNFGGSTCYFTDEGGLSFFLISKPPSNEHKEVFRAQVYPEHIPLSEVDEAYSIFVQTSRFEFILRHDSLTGKWYNQNGQPQIITMKEDYRNALPFEYEHGADSATATGKNNKPLMANVTYDGVRPSAKMKEKDAAFITKAIGDFMGMKDNKKTESLASIFTQKFISSFEETAQEGKKMDGSSFTGVYTLFPVYNDNGFLVMQKGGYQYDFDKKEYTDRYLYLCLDVKNKKTLTVADILEPNNDALTTLLENEFRKKYKLEPGKKITDLLKEDKLPLTDNIILANKGLIFSYGPSKVFKEREDISSLQEMRLFLSYEELDSLLKPAFKERIGLGKKGK